MCFYYVVILPHKFSILGESNGDFWIFIKTLFKEFSTAWAFSGMRSWKQMCGISDTQNDRFAESWEVTPTVSTCPSFWDAMGRTHALGSRGFLWVSVLHLAYLVCSEKAYIFPLCWRLTEKIWKEQGHSRCLANIDLFTVFVYCFGRSVFPLSVAV